MTTLDLTNVSVDPTTGLGVGVTPAGDVVKFTLSDADRDALKAVLFGDLAGNFTGVTIDTNDIVKGDT